LSNNKETEGAQPRGGETRTRNGNQVRWHIPFPLVPSNSFTLKAFKAAFVANVAGFILQDNPAPSPRMLKPDVLAQ